jgi:nucleoid-associated protein YgaU
VQTPPKPPVSADPAPAPFKGGVTDGTGTNGSGARGTGKGAFPATHVVEKGDSYWGISQKYFKDGRYASQIEKANPGVKLIPGKQITIPEIAIAAKEDAARRTTDDVAPAPARKDVVQGTTAKKPPAPGAESTEHVVQKGDTLTSIAKRYYKDASKFHLIEDANDDLKYQTLRIGMKIKIPPAR